MQIEEKAKRKDEVMARVVGGCYKKAEFRKSSL
jgi:hypothetical protein